MPSARCIECSRYYNFQNRRGSRLSDRKCQCGGALELVGGMVALEGVNPFNEKNTHESDYYTSAKKYWYATKNRSGELFYIEYGWEFWKPVTDYTLAKRAELLK